jgi:hypothetical protein
MPISGIKSKPVYAPLRADTRGRFHLMLGASEGQAALLRVLCEMQSQTPQALGATRVLLAPPAQSQFAGLALGEVRSFSDESTLLAEFNSTLQSALMGTRLYVAGPECFIGLAMKIALEFNMNKDEIRAEQLGSLARRVYCVHCRATTENVRTNIVSCVGCSRWLLVRDHYSRRLAAYMGVMVDAEVPGVLPPVVEVFV